MISIAVYVNSRCLANQFIYCWLNFLSDLLMAASVFYKYHLYLRNTFTFHKPQK